MIRRSGSSVKANRSSFRKQNKSNSNKPVTEEDIREYLGHRYIREWNKLSKRKRQRLIDKANKAAGFYSSKKDPKENKKIEEEIFHEEKIQDKRILSAGPFFRSEGPSRKKGKLKLGLKKYSYRSAASLKQLSFMQKRLGRLKKRKYYYGIRQIRKDDKSLNNASDPVNKEIKKEQGGNSADIIRKELRREKPFNEASVFSDDSAASFSGFNSAKHNKAVNQIVKYLRGASQKNKRAVKDQVKESEQKDDIASEFQHVGNSVGGVLSITAGSMIRVGMKAAGKELLIIIKAALVSFLTAFLKIIALIMIIVLTISVFFGIFSSLEEREEYGAVNLSDEVLAYESEIREAAKKYDMEDYVELIMAVMMQESGGRGSDPMQAAEGPYNKKYPKRPNGITDPSYSIECGVQELKSCLNAAGSSGPTDMEHIKLALQGYNYGNGYISWAKKKGGYTEENASEFSNMMAARLGWSGYGDKKYVEHVLRYYSVASASPASSSIVQIAKGEIGYSEGNGGYTKYGKWFGSSYAYSDWCAMFVSWCADEAGMIKSGAVPKKAGCQDMLDWFKSHDKYLNAGRTPQTGYLIFFDWNGDNWSDHVGIVESVSGKTIHTIEGNHSNKVERVTRSTSSGTIMGYGAVSESMILPVESKYYHITSYFGNRSAPTAGATTYHRGIDISKNGIYGKKVYAVLGGKVKKTGETTARGKYIVIDHGNNLYRAGPGQMSDAASYDDREDPYEVLRDKVEKNIDYAELVKENAGDIGIITALRDTMLDVLFSDSPSISVNNSTLPSKAVKDRMLKINKDDIADILDSLKNVRDRHSIVNPRQYLITALYNSKTGSSLRSGSSDSSGGSTIRQVHSKNSFNNFPQRKYDYKELETALIQKSRQSAYSGQQNKAPVDPQQ